jgi:hypothetical protein
MINLKVLSAAAAMALLLPMAAPTESFAQNSHRSKVTGARSGGTVHASRGARELHQGASPMRLSNDTGCYGRGVFISGSVAGGVGFCDNGYYER